MEGLTVAELKFKPRPLRATPSLCSLLNFWKSQITPYRLRLTAEFSLAGTKTPRVSGAVRSEEEETQKSKSQSAAREEWEVRKNKKQQIKGIIRGTETKSAVLNYIVSSKEQGKLPSHNLAADSRQEGCADTLRKPVWASGRAHSAVGVARNSFLIGMVFATAKLGGG